VAAPRVAEIMARELGWGTARRDLEAETYLASAREEYGIAPSPTLHESASEAMRTAPPVEGRIAG
jgi:hypothetical protein